MNTVSNFELVDRHRGYEIIKNLKQLNVAELTPREIRWVVDGIWRSRRSEMGIAGVLLSDRSGIAVVESPFEKEFNSAILINSNGSLRAKVNNFCPRAT